MTIFIRNKVITEERAVKLTPAPHDRRVKHLAKTWSDATVEHCFDGRKEFQKAVRRNQKVLQSRGKKLVIRDDYKDFFLNPKNFQFSTEARNREKTLYFGDAQRTGRLRQQHREGPLAKIDHHRRIRLFLSQDRFSSLKKWRKRNKEKFPTFYREELEPCDKTRHIEFAWDGVNVEWHASEGKVSTSREDVDRCIKRALRRIIGIAQGNAKSIERSHSLGSYRPTPVQSDNRKLSLMAVEVQSPERKQHHRQSENKKASLPKTLIRPHVATSAPQESLLER